MISSLQHIEIRVTDIRKARVFYGAVFSWTTEEGTPDYCFFDTGGNPCGAFVRVDAIPAGGNVTLFMKADKLEEKIAAIERHGGKVVQPKAPHPVPGRGSYALFEDPFGNRLGLWSPR